MARQQRLQTILERGVAALQDGDFEAAEAALQQCQRIDRHHPDVLILDGELSFAAGEIEAAEARFREVLAAKPDSPNARLGIARALLHQVQDAPDESTARRLCDEALELVVPLKDEPEALLIRIGVIASLDGDHPRTDEILDTMTAAIEVVPAIALDAASAIVHFAADRALAWLQIAAVDPDLRADALYEIGCVHAEGEQLEPQLKAWIEAWQLDGEEEVQVLADIAVFEEMTQAALDDLPEDLHKRLERVAILIDDRPSLDMVKEGVDPRSLGLFTGTPTSDEQAGIPALTQIHIFKQNLERVCRDLDELDEQVRITVMHETAHFFGLDEDAVARLGLE
jgi:predicted Zn-dependent protease with MMP-like domain